MITCISDLYYKIGWWFTVMMFTIAFITLPLALDIYDSIWTFLMCSGIAFVGAAPHYKGGDYNMHYTAAVTSGICSIIWIININVWFLLIVASGLIISILDRKRWLLWGELGCFISVFSILIYK